MTVQRIDIGSATQEVVHRILVAGVHRARARAETSSNAVLHGGPCYESRGIIVGDWDARRGHIEPSRNSETPTGSRPGLEIEDE